jgi:putative Ca2+/H+ antiporter (TMEM165/GDT1 family)
VEALLLSTGIIFLAELGDKSQLMALTFATRFRARTVLLGITIATALVHVASVLIGVVVGSSIPTHTISILAGAAFMAFAGWTLRATPSPTKRSPGRSEHRARRWSRSVSSSFWLSRATRPCWPP